MDITNTFMQRWNGQMPWKEQIKFDMQEMENMYLYTH